MTFIEVALGIILYKLLCYLFVYQGHDNERDDTDGDKISGLIIHTDNRTGIQYLSTSRGGLTPRLDSDGNFILSSKKN